MPSDAAIPSERSARDELRHHGLKATAGRIAVLDALRIRPHSDAAALHAAVLDTMPAASLQSVYNALTDLTGAGLLRRIEPAGRSALYERRTGDNHHHLVCRDCGRIEDIDCAVGAAPCLTVSDDHGFVVDEAEVTFWGICSSCQTISS